MFHGVEVMSLRHAALVTVSWWRLRRGGALVMTVTATMQHARPTDRARVLSQSHRVPPQQQHPWTRSCMPSTLIGTTWAPSPPPGQANLDINIRKSPCQSSSCLPRWAPSPFAERSTGWAGGRPFFIWRCTVHTFLSILWPEHKTKAHLASPSLIYPPLQVAYIRITVSP